jgi:hypothetical protein
VAEQTDVFRFTNGLFEVNVLASDLGLTSPTQSFDFLVATLRGSDPNNPVVDQAPDSDVFTYTLTGPPPPPPPVPAPKVSGSSVSVVSTPKAGLRFVVGLFSIDLSDGTTVATTGQRCTARLGSSALRGTGSSHCIFALPATARGKLLKITVAGRYHGRLVTKHLAYRVH